MKWVRLVQYGFNEKKSSLGSTRVLGECEESGNEGLGAEGGRAAFSLLSSSNYPTT